MKPTTLIVQFGAALVASIAAIFIISTFVNMIVGTPTNQMEASPIPEKQQTAEPAMKTAQTAETKAPASAPAKASAPAPAAKPAVNLKKHPGRKIYLRKGACAACHGRNGRRAISYYPAIAGQDKKYIVQQIKDIMKAKRQGGIDEATGHPRSEAMRGALIAPDGSERITGDQIAQMADWLTRLEPAKPRAPETPISAESAAAGKKLFKKCIACHGKMGKKPLKGYPFVAGQKRIYLVQQMTDIKSGKRSNGKVKIMLPFVKKLSDEQIGSLADYLTQIDRTAK